MRPKVDFVDVLFIGFLGAIFWGLGGAVIAWIGFGIEGGRFRWEVVLAIALVGGAAAIIIYLLCCGVKEIRDDIQKSKAETKAQASARTRGWRSLRQGMDKSAVRSTLGEPTKVSHTGAIEVWEFGRSAKAGMCTFVDDKLFQWGEP